jgi:hypothetical protein
MSNVARRRHARELVLATALAVVILLLLVDCDPTGSARAAGDGAGGAGSEGSSTSFSIVGNASEPMSPGVRAPLDLKLANPHSVPMSVTDLSVTVRSVNAPNADSAHPCSIGDFAVRQASSGISIVVSAGATSTLSELGLARATWPHIAMLERPVNQDGCKGASLMLGYSATGKLAES